MNKYDVLLFLQLFGIFIAYREHLELTKGSIPKMLSKAFILFLPTILYINLKRLNAEIIF